MKVFVTRTVGMKTPILKRVMDLLLPHTGPMQFIECSKPLMFRNDSFSWDEFFGLSEKFKIDNSIDEDDFLIVLTELSNDANWFSACDPNGKRVVFVYTSDWEKFIYCPSEFPIAYQIIENIFQHQMFVGEDEEKYIHFEPIGCMNDMCGWKPDISFKLRTADICQDCLELLSKKVSKDYLSQGISIFESLRKQMLFNKNYQKQLTFEENLPFTIAITKRKLGMSLEPFRKMLLLIDHFDSLVRTAVLMIAHLSMKKEDITGFFEEQHLSDKPSMGSWVDALAILAARNIDNDWGFQLPGNFASKVKWVVEKANEGKIVMIRNEKRGHGYIDCHDSSYKNQFMQSLPVIDEIEQLLSPLLYRFKYFHIINQSRLQGNKFRIRVHNLSGSNPGFLEEEMNVTFDKVEDIPLEDHVYLVSPDISKWVDLHPHFHFGECPICHHNRLLIADGKYLLDPYIGHRFETN